MVDVQLLHTALTGTAIVSAIAIVLALTIIGIAALLSRRQHARHAGITGGPAAMADSPAAAARQPEPALR